MLPLATTTITVRSAGSGEPYEAPSGAAVLATGVPAHLSSPSGLERLEGGGQQVIDKRLLADPTLTLDHTMTVVDDGTGATYTVVWVDNREGLGLDHVVAGLRRVGAPV